MLFWLFIYGSTVLVRVTKIPPKKILEITNAHGSLAFMLLPSPQPGTKSLIWYRSPSGFIRYDIKVLTTCTSIAIKIPAGLYSFTSYNFHHMNIISINYYMMYSSLFNLLQSHDNQNHSLSKYV